MKSAIKIGTLTLALLGPAGLFGQTQAPTQAQPPSYSCHPLDSVNNWVGPDEQVVGNQACKIVTNPVAQKQATSPAPPALSAATATPVVAANPTPVPTANAIEVPPTDGKIRLYVTDEPKDESIFLAAHRSGWHVDGQSSGQVSGSVVNGTGSISGSSNGSVHGSGGSAGAAYGYSEKGGDPRTVEIEADIYNACPTIVVTKDPARGDYALLFRRQGGKRSQMFIFGGLTGLALSAHSKVDGASVFDRNGDMVFATRERTVGKAIKEVCGHLK